MPTDIAPKAFDRYNKKLNRLRQLGFEPSTEQEAVFLAIANPDRKNLFVEATAGSGKTTTILKGMNFCPLVDGPVGLQTPNILYLVFSKDMADSVNARNDLPPNLTCATTHSFGFSALRGSGRHSRYKISQYAVHDFVKSALGPSVNYQDYRYISSAVADAVSTIKNRGLHYWEVTVEHAADLLTNHALENSLDPEWIAGYANLVIDALAEDTSDIDFDDMLYRPATDSRIALPSYDWVFVDESQDLNPCQIKLLKRLDNGKTRFVFVGDRNQSIFAFRGADPAAVEKLVKSFDATLLPLSTTYRCAKAVVRMAQGHVPAIAARDDAPEGSVQTIDSDDFLDLFLPGDMALCRVNAPLVKECLRFIARGKKARVIGRDIGKSLFNLYKSQVLPSYRGDNYAAVHEAYANVAAKMVRPGDEHQLAILRDRYDALITLIPTKDATENQIKEVIESVFTDDKPAYSFSSIHKAKGLEADRVFLLRPDLLPFPKATTPTEIAQERNLSYVAVTRAKSDFFIVQPPSKNDE